MKEILTNKTYKDYSYISRYANIPVYYNNLDNKYMYGTAYQLSDDNNYLLHKVRKNETFDSISLTYYNTPLYYWVIMDFNKFQDPFVNLEEGQELLIPTLSSIKFEVDK